MTEFLSSEWFVAQNDTLAALGRSLVLSAEFETIRVVVQWDDGPATMPHAVTLTGTSGSLTLSLGDHLAADAIVRVHFADARGVLDGSANVADALREGRVKLRGDSGAVVALMNAVRAASNSAEA